MQYYAAGNPPPSTASVIVTATQQSGIMAGTGITAINSLTGAVQTLGVGTSGTDFAISSIGTSHTFNLPTASSTNRGALSSSDWTIFNNKQNALTNPITGTGTNNEIAYFTASGTIGSLTTGTYPSLTELSYVKGVTSGIQTQLGTKQASSTNLTSLSGLTYASTSFVKMTAAGTFALDTNTYLTSVGTGTTNELTYWSGTNTISSLTTSTYPSLTELSYVKGVTSGIQTQITGKQTDSAWVDCSSNSISGWSATTTKIMQYKLLGSKTMIFQFEIVGTGSGTTSSITLPFTSSAWGNQYNMIHAINSAASAITPAIVGASSTTLNVYPAANIATTWTNAVARTVRGTITINLA
jgi:hypothetical protein